jgi:hypothetical protein
MLDGNREHRSSIMGGVSIHFHIHQKGNHLRLEDHVTDNRDRTPSVWDNVKIFGEVSFSHTIIRPVNGKSVGDFLGIIVNGRVDHGIGRIVTHSRRDQTSQPKRRFQSLLLVVEAKTAFSLERALPQLVVYLGSLHQSRLRRGRSNATVYGVVSDGYSFIFATVTHDGVLKRSKYFEVKGGDMQTVLGCLKYLLETSASMSPNVRPERDGGEPVGDQSDGESDMDVDDTDYF